MKVLISTKQAAEILGLSPCTTREILVTYDHRETGPRGRARNYYKRGRVWEVRAAREAGTFIRPPRKYPRKPKHYYKKAKPCLRCGKKTTSLDQVCKRCNNGEVNIDDPYGVMLPVKFQDRPCPCGCNTRLREGEWQCRESKMKNLAAWENSLDEFEAYGSIAL